MSAKLRDHLSALPSSTGRAPSSTSLTTSWPVEISTKENNPKGFIYLRVENSMKAIFRKEFHMEMELTGLSRMRVKKMPPLKAIPYLQTKWHKSSCIG
jgi:hypothetical protein